MVFIEELSRGPLIDLPPVYDPERHRYASKASGSSSSFLEEPLTYHHHYPFLLLLVPILTIWYMLTFDNLKCKSDVCAFAFGVLSYVIGMDWVLSRIMNTVDLFVE